MKYFIPELLDNQTMRKELLDKAKLYPAEWTLIV